MLEWTVMVAALSSLALTFVMIQTIRSGDALIPGLKSRLASNAQRLRVVALGLALYVPFHASCGIVKQRLNEIYPFWADRMLADWDAALFGTDPAQWLHQRLTAPILTLLDFGYSLWFPVNALCFITCLFYGRGRLLLAYFLLWGICGPMGQVLMSSAGPLFWPNLGYGERFDGLIANLSFGPIYGARYLWLTFMSEEMSFGAGIAAVPSLHVAGSAWVAACSYRTRLMPLGFSYFAMISIGSVALGWHYAVDGIIGVGCTIVMLALTSLYPFKRRTVERGQLARMA
ncbi:phosphatase PAP2 family protein [Croceicoccus sediminis]|uniref:phosphatase PAP2 family protein n=1 Tax=Croceicoccus sediminis TaxID=2571150 RepID=UPI00196A991E|nr:phosphatase PAP2 family protein [Croceicoccus sediminis]